MPSSKSLKSNIGSEHYQALMADIARLNAEAAQVRREEALQAIAQIHAIMAKFGLIHEDLFGVKAAYEDLSARSKKAHEGLPRRKRTRMASNVDPSNLVFMTFEAKAPVCYRDADTGNTWDGVGEEPTWLAGRDKDAFSVTLRDD